MSSFLKGCEELEKRKEQCFDELEKIKAKVEVEDILVYQIRKIKVQFIQFMTERYPSELGYVILAIENAIEDLKSYDLRCDKSNS